MGDNEKAGKRNVYLNMISAKEAVQRIISALDREKLVHSEFVDAARACGRILSGQVQARLSSPAFHSAAMDGVAVEAAKTYAAREGFPVTLVESGVAGGESEGNDVFHWVNTGNTLPPECDAVIMIEHVQKQVDGSIKIESPAFPWQHVRRLGEDIVATELLFTRNHKLNPYDIGALLSGGIWEVQVWEKIKICILPTGDEVLDVASKPEPKAGQVVESNSHVLALMAENLGCEAKRLPALPDDPEKIKEAVEKALETDAQVIVLCSGSSAGSRDYTRQVFAELADNKEVLLHGISTMPGKPTLAAVSKGKLLMGAPGYPVSMVVSFEEVLAKVLAWLGHVDYPGKNIIPAMVAKSVPSKPGMEELVRVSVGQVGEKYIATPLNRSAGCITSLTKAQGILRIPAGNEGVSRGSISSIELLSSESHIKDVLLCTGSHDNLLDVLADALMDTGKNSAQYNSDNQGNFDRPTLLVSTNVGSMGGISSLSSRSCHLAGMHLFDPVSNDFNYPFLKRHAPDLDVVLINLAIRQQGFIVQAGNPKKITVISDLTRKDVHFINRQHGSGTRILFDYYLKKNSIKVESISGYDKDEFTHMAVAVNVLTGAADCGMGIMAAAKSLQLDFIPLLRERYDLAIAREFIDDPKVVHLRKILNSEEFKDRVSLMGGYETTLTGKEMKEGQTIDPGDM